jgi:hypothetical protein
MIKTNGTFSGLPRQLVFLLFLNLIFLQASFAQPQATKQDTVHSTVMPAPVDSPAAAQPASEPFAFGDFSWLNGTSRKTSPPAFDSKYFTGDVTFDFNYTHSYNRPIDNTVVGSTALARNNDE